MTLENLVRLRELHSEPPDKREFLGLVKASIDRLRDAENKVLSYASRYDLAYNAAHGLALAALRAAGYRSDKRYLVFQCLVHTVNLSKGQVRMFSICHERRNRTEYEGYFETDDRDRITIINYSGAKLLGWESPEAVCGKKMAQFWGSSAQEESFTQELAEDGEIKTYEAFFLRKDGTEIIVELDAYLLYNARGEVTGKSGVFTDVTERAKGTTEESHPEVEKRYKTMFNNPLHMVYVIDEQGHLLDVNDAALKKIGYSRSELESISFKNVIHSDDMGTVFAAMQEALEKGHMEHPIEVRIFSKHGDMLWVECLGVTTERSEDHFEALGIARDITERKKSEESTILERDRAQRYLDIAGVLFVAINTKGEITLVNKKGCEILGYSHEEIIGVNWFGKFLPERMKDEVDSVFKALIAGETELVEYFENAIVTRDGEERIIAWHNTAVTDELGNITGTLSSGEDITDRKESEESLRQSEGKLKGLVEKLRLSQEELYTPVVQVWDRILALPLIGLIDNLRAEKIIEVLLPKIVNTHAEVVVLDVTGVASMDTAVTNHLMRTIQSCKLLGARCVITGIRPEVAQSIIHLGIDTGDFITKRDMQEGIKWALENRGNNVGQIY